VSEEILIEPRDHPEPAETTYAPVDPWGKVVSEKLATLQELFEARLRFDEVKQGAFEALYVELTQYKQDFLTRAIEPVLRDLCLLYDNLIKEKTRAADPAPLERLRAELLEVLYRQGLSVLAEDGSGQEPDRNLHRAIGSEPTDDAAKAGRIASTAKHGFERNGKIFRPQQVIVFKHTPSE
jgi:molecular chaperone GrpE (heat shock protein)